MKVQTLLSFVRRYLRKRNPYFDTTTVLKLMGKPGPGERDWILLIAKELVSYRACGTCTVVHE